MVKEYVYSTTDQPEVVNEPKILYDRHNLDARGIPKVGNLRNSYQMSIDELFFATEKAYFIMGKSAKIVGEEGDDLIFQFIETGEQKGISRQEAHAMMEETFQEGCLTQPKLYIPFFGEEFLHKLESDARTLDDPRTKEALQERYEREFSDKEPNQRTVNSLFYLSILLDRDKEKQKVLAKYFINNCLNTLYREKDTHYGLHKNYDAKDIRQRLGIQVHPKKEDEGHIYLPPTDCKKIAEHFGITDDEFSDILYDVCMFKLGDTKKSIASFHRKSSTFLNECKEYLKPEQKDEVENYQYIYANTRYRRSGIYYNIDTFHKVQLLLEMGETTKNIKEKLEVDDDSKKTFEEVINNNKKKISITDILDDTIKKTGEEVYARYEKHLCDIDFSNVDYKTRENNVFLVAEDKDLILTDKKDDHAERGEILGSLCIATYNEDENRRRIEIYRGREIDKKLLYSIKEILFNHTTRTRDIVNLNY